jgi:L-ribulokinase
MAIAKATSEIPGLCGIVPGSIHPGYIGIEAGLSATGYLFESIARRSNTTVAALGPELDAHRAGDTGLLRIGWDNGDRTVLVNPLLGGVTLGWNLNSTAADELFAAIEGTAFNTRIILDRMHEHGVPIERVIHAGGIPQKNEAVNRVYANVLNKPVLIPERPITSLGSAIFACVVAGLHPSIEAAQRTLCPPYRTVHPDPAAVGTYQQLFSLYRKLYFALGDHASTAVEVGDVLPALRAIAAGGA